jgi:hypothetical protein
VNASPPDPSLWFGADEMSCADTWNDAEDLLTLARKIEALAPGAVPDLQAHLNHLLSPLAATEMEPLEIEQRLDAAATQLRRAWLEAAHRTSDLTQKSPTGETTLCTPAGTRVDYGYERDLKPESLERRAAAAAVAVEGWCAEHVLLSSGQATLTAVLLALSLQSVPRVVHLGGYFETRELLRLLDGRLCDYRRVLRLQEAEDLNADLLLLEPVFCDNGLHALDLARVVRLLRETSARPKTILIDTTLAATSLPLAKLLGDLLAIGGMTVMTMRSGLKLDQAGLELANVGILSVYAPRRGLRTEGDLAERIRRIRSLVGGGLTLDEMTTLEAPWFLDRAYFERYSAAVFASNAALAAGMPLRSPRFVLISHPHRATPHQPWAQAPFVSFHLADPTLAAYRALEGEIEAKAAERGLRFPRGGSFGFRGHRYEVVVPEPGQGLPFLRVAMGARGGETRRGIIRLLREIALTPAE